MTLAKNAAYLTLRFLYYFDKIEPFILKRELKKKNVRFYSHLSYLSFLKINNIGFSMITLLL